jgi:hypothetical protein
LTEGLPSRLSRATVERRGGAQAKSSAGFAQVSTHEATRPSQRPELLRLSLAGLEKSVDEFKTTHPRLVEIVGSLSASLSNLGL